MSEEKARKNTVKGAVGNVVKVRKGAREAEPPENVVMMDTRWPERAKMEHLVSYLTEFEKPRFKFGKMVSVPPDKKFGCGSCRIDYHKLVKQFLQDCLESGFLFAQPDPKWGSMIPELWEDATRKVLKNIEYLGQASMFELRCYLSTQFQFASVTETLMYLEFKKGAIVRMLRRIKELLAIGEEEMNKVPEIEASNRAKG